MALRAQNKTPTRLSPVGVISPAFMRTMGRFLVNSITKSYYGFNLPMADKRVKGRNSVHEGSV